MSLRSNSEIIVCPPQPEHGHPDVERTVTLKWLRFLDCIYARFPEAAAGENPAWVAEREKWGEVNFITFAEDPIPAHAGCWDWQRVRLMRPLLWEHQSESESV